MEIQEGTIADAPTLARMFRQMWLDNGVNEDSLVDDAEARVIEFVDEGIRLHRLRMFFAVRGDVFIGGAACQRFAGLYPNVLTAKARRYGYLWGIYVSPSARQRGVGAALTKQCIEALRDDDCTHAFLHAAPMGIGIYERLGFESTNEMCLLLRSE